MANKETKKEEKISNLLDSILTLSTIDCTKCKKEDTTSGDAYDVVEGFYEEGWRATLNHTYCPKCAKKYLKTP